MPSPTSNIFAILTASLAVLICSALPVLAQDDTPEKAEAAKAEKTEQAEAPETEKEEIEKPTKSRVFLANGDSLRGTPLSVDDQERLLFKSESLRNTALFPLKNVVAIQMESWKERPRAETLTRVELQPRFREDLGDTIIGELHELTPDSIKLKTWYGGTITLKRSMVKSLKIISNSKGNYYGPNNLSEWELPSGEDTWTYESGRLVSQDTGSIGKDVELTEKSHISFTLDWKTSIRFKMKLYSSDVSDTGPDAYYEININRSYAYLTTRGKTARNGARMLGGGARWRQIQIARDKKSARFDLYADRKLGTITVYIDGRQACILQSQTPDPENLGTGLSFRAESRYPIEISGITVTPWNGTTLPGTQAAAVAPPAAEGEEKDKKPPHKIILSNGDEVPGTVGKVQDGRMIIDTELTPIKIPLKRIKSLSLGDAQEQPKKYRGDIRAWLHDGGFVTLRLKSFADGKINGFSQAMGDVSFDLAAFNRIDFLIYDPEANELRKELR